MTPGWPRLAPWKMKCRKRRNSPSSLANACRARKLSITTIAGRYSFSRASSRRWVAASPSPISVAPRSW